MLWAAIVEFQKYIKDLDLNPFKPVSFKAVHEEIDRVVEWHNKRWVRWLILAAAATVIIGGCALFAYWYLMRRTQATMFPQASGVSAILDRFMEQRPKRANPPAPTAPPEPTGARARPRTSRNQEEDLGDMEEMFNLLSKPSRGASPMDDHPIIYTPCQERGNSTYTGLKLDLGSEERRKEFESLVNRINRKRELDREQNS